MICGLRVNYQARYTVFMKLQRVISSYCTEILEVQQKLAETYENELNECVIYSVCRIL